MYCCCNRKNNNTEMINIMRDNQKESLSSLSNIYELVMTPSDNEDFLPETQPSIQKTTVVSPKKSNVYVHFFELDTPTTPTTPVAFQELYGNMIHVQIPKNTDLYINYEKYNILR